MTLSFKKTAQFFSVSDVLKHCKLDEEESAAFCEAMCDSDAAYGTNAHSLVAGQFICETLLEELNEEWSGRLLDKLQTFLLVECDDRDVLIDLEG